MLDPLCNEAPHTGARPSVRLCAGPELARCVLWYSKNYGQHRFFCACS
jgi:hypothetical protein